MKHFLLLLTPFLFLTGCLSPSPAPDPAKLRVGVSPDSPPLIFKQGGQISGVEADFARKLSKELNRELVFVEVPWSKQINYLEENKTDIIMSGMSITSTREYRVNFTKPYMVSGLTAIFRRTDYAPAGLFQSVMRHQSSSIGVIKDTTGEIFSRNSYEKAKILVFNDKEGAVAALKKGKVNMVIHDAPLIWWIAAENEADLVAFPKLMNNESLAWGISKNNLALLEEVNLILENMKNDGSGEKVLQNWFPR